MIRAQSWEELTRKAVKGTGVSIEEELRDAGFKTRGEWSDLWGVPNTTATHRLHYLTKAGVMERREGLLGSRTVSFWGEKS